ncbi:MAG: hypothetical protein BroJett011_62960 [Chloroflexota bacterium]|nr:MAG: hypothetical protein BroJett011_62960 [Chloroflexota bacterium]
MNRIYAIFSASPKALPCNDITPAEKNAWLGQTLTLAGQVWKIVEVQKWRGVLYIQITAVAPALAAARLN